MKKYCVEVCISVTLFMPSIVTLSAMADTETIGNYTWRYRINGDTVEIQGVFPRVTGVVTIPSTLGGKPVTGIGNHVFWYCSDLTGVTIPNSVTSIGDSAFSWCSGLTSVTIPDSVTSIGNSAFDNCSGLTSVTIPNSVTSIGNSAFDNCSGLTSVTIPNSVTNIGSYAFSDCSGLTSVYIIDLAAWCRIFFGWKSFSYGHNLYLNGSIVTDLVIPNDVTGIGDFAFFNCSGLTSVTIPDNVTSIGDSVFSGCSGLMSFVVADSNPSYSSISGLLLTKDGKTLVAVPGGLTSVAIPDGVRNIRQRMFYDCHGLMSFVVADTNPSYRSVSGLLLTKDSRTLVAVPKGLTSVTIPDGVTNIGKDAFSGSANLVRVTIPNSVTNIGSYAFSDCSGLTSVTIPDSVTSIWNATFSFCSSLTSVTIPNSVTNIGTSAFSFCSSLTSVTIPDSVTSIGYGAFEFCDNLTVVNITDLAAWCNISFGEIPFECPYNLYLNGELIMGLQIPNGITVLGNSVFSCCSSLTSVAIPNSVTSIGASAFSYCSSLTNVTIPDSVTNIGRSAFRDCSGLTSVMIPNSVTNIGFSAFSGCSGLAKVYLSSMFSGSIDVFPSGAEIIRYKPDQVVTLDANGGTVSPANVMMSYNSVYGVLPEPSRTGHSFEGWKYCDELVSSNTIVSALDDHTLVAQWALNKYMVTFDANGGVGGMCTNQNYGTSIIVPTVTRTDYTFNGWSPGVAATVPASNVTYTAQWQINQYTVTFDANGGSGGTSVRQDYGTEIVAPMVTWVGHVFKGWMPNVAATVPGSNVTYTAQWQVNRYTIPLNIGCGTCDVEEMNVEHGAAIGRLPVPTCENAVFLGWFTAAEGGEKVTEDTVFTEGMTLYAHWLTEVANPIITSDAGSIFRTDSCLVTISCATEGAKIYYTDDGTTPKKNNEEYLYTGPITISETTTFKAISVVEGLSSGYVTTTITKKPITLEEALGVGEGIVLATSEAVPWTIITDATAQVGDKTARSGAIGNKTNTCFSATVSGSGTMTFWCKVSCEHDEDGMFTWDRLMVYTNDVEIVDWRMDGETGWTERTLAFDGGVNTVKWVYYKDRTGAEGEDCAWVDGVIWTPSGPADVVVPVNGTNVTVSGTWLAEKTQRTATDDAANGRKVWQCYMLGLDPERADDDFRITRFWMDGNVPMFEFSHTTDGSGNTFVPRIRKMGATTPEGPWTEVPAAGNPAYRFFKAEVMLP